MGGEAAEFPVLIDLPPFVVDEYKLEAREMAFELLEVRLVLGLVLAMCLPRADGVGKDVNILMSLYQSIMLLNVSVLNTKLWVL